MSARRCSIGCESWPDEVLFATCTHCGERTRRVNVAPTIDRDAAVRIKLYELFEKYYERRCQKMGIPADGPLPDDSPIPVDSPCLPSRR